MLQQSYVNEHKKHLHNIHIFMSQLHHKSVTFKRKIHNYYKR